MPRRRLPPVLVGVGCVLALAGGTPGAAAADRSGPTGRLLVTDRDGATRVIPAGNAAARAALTAQLKRDPQVVAVVPERRAAVRSMPNDPVLWDQDPLAPPGVDGAWWAKQMDLPRAWNLANGSGITIAVIDTGIDSRHPQLRPVVVRALTESRSKLPGTARTDEAGHGTHVASLACSAFNDAAGTVGAGGRCQLIAIKSDLYDTSVAAAVTRATKLGADAIVMSFGVDGVAHAPLVVRRAMESAAKHGVVLVAAAADSPTTQQGYPANILQPTGTGPHLNEGIGLTVTAATVSNQRAGFAGHGSQISVAAYGAYAAIGGPPGIIGAFPPGHVLAEGAPGTGAGATAQRTAIDGDNRYAYQAGTSMAAPMVAGVAGLVRDANPDLDARQIVRVIKQTATRRGGWNDQTGWGVVNAYAAVNTARRIDLRPPRARFLTRARRVHAARLRLRWQASDKSPRPLVASGVRRVEVWRSVDGGPYRRVGAGKRGFLTVSVPHGRVRFTLRGVDRAGNRAALSSRGAVTITR